MADDFEKSLLAAKDAILRAPQLREGGQPLYRVPWFLFLGDGEAEIPKLLKAAFAGMPFAEPQAAGGDGPSWRWWFYKGMIAIETSPALVAVGDPKAAAAWAAIHQCLGKHRPAMPLNGIVLAVPAARLTERADAVRDRFLPLRRLLDETAEKLKSNVPHYLVVTECDALPGYGEFMAALPDGVDRQAVGCRVEEKNVSTAFKPDGGMVDTILKRLRALRHGMLHERSNVARRLGIYECVEQFLAMRGGLNAAVAALSEPNPFQHTPFMRGLYFTSAAARPAFYRDLFDRFLPVDQPLARHN